jgi:hypothetical protein
VDIQGQIDAWLTRLANERKASPHTIEGYRRDLAKLVRYMQTQQIASFDMLMPHRMRGFIAAEHRDGLSPKSLQRLLSSCRSLFRQLTREGMLAHDPLAGVRGPKVHRKLPEVLDVDEATALVEGEGGEALNVRDRAMLELFYSSGLRLSELIGLRWLDLDLDAGEVYRASGPPCDCRAACPGRVRRTRGGVAGIPWPPRRTGQSAYRASTDESACTAPGFRQTRASAFAAAHLRQPHAGIFRRSACRAGIAGACRHCHHADLYALGFPAPGQGLRRSSSAGEA